MRLGYFTMPLHPLHPLHRDTTETLHEDRQTIIYADRLGFYDAFVGDHLAKGRFIFGISPGALASDAESLGMLDQDRNKLFAEAIDVILAIWQRDPPYDIDFENNRFKVTTRQTAVPAIGRGELMKPFQKPYPEVVGTVVAPFSKGVIAMGQRDFHPMSANFLLSHWLPSHWANYAQGKSSVGQQAKASDWRVARTIFVSDDASTAKRYGHEDANSPYRYYYYQQMLTKMKTSNRHVIFKRSPDEDDSLLTLDRLMGDFGEIVYAGMDLVDPALGRRSMELMAQEVMPRVNQALGLGSAINV